MSKQLLRVIRSTAGFLLLSLMLAVLVSGLMIYRVQP